VTSVINTKIVSRDRSATQPSNTGPASVVAWPFQLSIVVTFVTAFVALPGPPIVRILPTAFFLGIGILRTSAEAMGRVRFDPFLILFFVWCVASLIWSIDRTQSAQQLFREFSRVISMTVATSILGYHRTRRTLRAIILVCIAASLAWWVIFPTASFVPLFGDTETGLRVFFANKNTLAKVALLSILFLVSEKSLGRKRLFWVAGAVLLLRFTTATTALFSAILGVAIFAVIVASERLDRRGRTLSRILTLLFGLLLFAIASVTSVTSLVSATGKDATLTGRTEIWKVALPFAQEKLATGYGFGAIWEADNGPGPEINRQVGDFLVVDAHNSYLEQVLQVGAVGSFLMAGWVLSTLRRASAAMVRKSNDAAWILGSIAALTLLGISDAVFIGWLSWFALLSSMSYQLSSDIEAESDQNGSIQRGPLEVGFIEPGGKNNTRSGQQLSNRSAR
jgi:exopolysaccharide production protein ExoQ